MSRRSGFAVALNRLRKSFMQDQLYAGGSAPSVTVAQRARPELGYSLLAMRGWMPDEEGGASLHVSRSNPHSDGRTGYRTPTRLEGL